MGKIKRFLVGQDGVKLWPFVALVGAVGFVMTSLGIAMVWSTGWGKDLLVPGATLMTVSLSTYVAARGIVSWEAQRKRDRVAAEYKHRESVYEEIAGLMVKRFGVGSYDREADVDLRAKAALWGTASSVAALAYWQTVITQVMDNHNISEGPVGLAPMERAFLLDAFGRAMQSMRADLGSEAGDDVELRQLILQSIFNE